MSKKREEELDRLLEELDEIIIAEEEAEQVEEAQAEDEEQESQESDLETEPTESSEEGDDPDETSGEESQYLSETDVATFLSRTRLPEVVKQRLGKGQYSDLDDLKTAAANEIEYVKAVTGSGKPFGLGETQEAPADIKLDEKAYKERLDEINKKWLGA